MNEKPQENQQELFSDFAAPTPRAPERAPSFTKTPKPILISTTLEQVLLASLILILVLCLVFFLGVLRGRYIAGPDFAAHAAVSASPASSPVPKRAASPAAAPTAVQPRPQAVSASSTAKPAPVPVAAPAPPASPASADAKPYTIQVLTSKKKAQADSETASLRGRGINAWMMRSGDYYVVCVGYYKNKDEAKKDLGSLKSKYSSAYLRRR